MKFFITLSSLIFSGIIIYGIEAAVFVLVYKLIVNTTPSWELIFMVITAGAISDFLLKVFTDRVLGPFARWIDKKL
jgi:hypothetical protein